MNDTLAPVLRKFALVFFDDILIYSKTFPEHLVHLSSVLSLLQTHQWQVKLSKCAFAQSSISYLGHVISGSGVATDPSKIVTITQWPTPSTVKEVRVFLGITGYYRKFIKHYGIIAKPLTDLLRKGALFVWTLAVDTDFQTLKQALITAPVLALPDFNKTFVIETDASDSGIGAVLMQEGHPIAYVSRSLGPKNKGLSVYENEYMAILWAIQQWRSYVQFAEFVIQTDQKSLIHLADQRLHTVWQQRALTKLMGLHYRLNYKKGSDNKAVDALSRKPFDQQHVLALSVVQPVWLTDIVASYVSDVKAQELLQQLALAPDHTVGSYTLQQSLIRKSGRIWVASDIPLQLRIIGAFHSSPVGGHSGVPVTSISLFRPAMCVNVPSLKGHCILASCNLCLSPVLLGKSLPWILLKVCLRLISTTVSW